MFKPVRWANVQLARHFPALLSLAVVATGCVRSMSPLDRVRESHVRANVPGPLAFDAMLRRDMTEYFDGAEVKVDLLSRKPTQAGVGLPKFYVWVEAVTAERLTVEGAARLAAVERERLEVVQFLTAEEIRADPARVSRIFPTALVREIRRRAEGRGLSN